MRVLILLIGMAVVVYVRIAVKLASMKKNDDIKNAASSFSHRQTPASGNSKKLHSKIATKGVTQKGTNRTQNTKPSARLTSASSVQNATMETRRTPIQGEVSYTQSSAIAKSAPESPLTNTIASSLENTTFCFMSQDRIIKTAKSFARAFPDRFDRNWIIPPDSDPLGVYEGTNHTNAGILYVKNFKAASTTTAGAAFRMAYQVSEDVNVQRIPKRDKPAWVKAHHTRGNHYSNRYPKKSFLFTSVREPSSRAMSRIFYTSITQKGEKPTDENILSKLRWNQLQFGAVSHMGGGYQVRYVSMHKTLPTSWLPERPDDVYDPAGVHASVAQIFQDYDFILVAERLDESLVTMALLLGIDVQDVLVQSAKVGASSKYLYFTVNKKKAMRESCMPYVKTFVSPVVQDHLDSVEWHAKNYGDFLLHAAANLSLDMTMDRIGRTRVNTALQEYRRLSQKAKQQCSNETIYHCAEDGTPQRHLSKPNCYEDDSGCGYPCVDRMLLLEGAKSTSTNFHS
jgi:hypothetical protein